MFLSASRSRLLAGEANGCEYCISAHAAIVKMVGLPSSEIPAIRQARGSNPKAEIALKFAPQLVSNPDWPQRRQPSAAIKKYLRYSDGDIAEIVTIVALILFTNRFNLLSQTHVVFTRINLDISWHVRVRALGVC